jgi:hypothetical protein
MRSGRISAGALALVCLTLTPASAAQEKKPSKPPKTDTASKPKAAGTTTRDKANTAGNDSVARSIDARPWLAARIQPLLPRGSSIASASIGFKNDGQFLAALHASQNLSIPFPTLKNAVIGANAVSLVQAIRVMRRLVDATAEANRAEQQATSDLHR